MLRLHVLLLFFVASLVMPVWAGTGNDAMMRSAAGRVLKSSRPIEMVASYPKIAIYRQSGGGFAIVSSNKETPTVLAYSRTGDFDLSSDNPGFNWWLNAVKKALILSPNRETTKPDPSRFPTHVDPLITTLWGQREPFKFMCPFDHYVSDQSLYGTYQPDSGHYSLGCGPAAMA